MEDQPPPIGSEAEFKNVHLLALREAVLAISSNLSLAETLRRIVVAAAQLVDAQYAALGVPDESGEFLVEFITTGLAPEEEARISHRPRGLGLLGLISREGKSLRLRDLRAHPRSAGFPPHHPEMTSFLGVPVVHKGKLLGNLYLTNKQSADEFTADDQRLIELLASHAGISIENARLYEKVQQLSVIEERQRIGMDLHDGVIQSIYAAGLTLEYIQSQLGEGDTAGAAQGIQKAIEALNATIRDIRAYILDLRPRRFEGDNLVAGLERLIAEFKANTLIAVEFAADRETDKWLTPEARLALFHIAQEALSNAAKHSRASRMEVTLSRAASQVTLVLRDNGHGFASDAVERHVGHGLMNMQDRAQAVGGQLLVESRNGQGTTVQVKIPSRAHTG